MLGELLLLATLAAEADSLWYSGRDGELEVNPPKLVDPRINVDGILDEKRENVAVSKLNQNDASLAKMTFEPTQTIQRFYMLLF